MEKELLREAREKACSFPGLEPPNNAEPIGQIEEAHDTYFYYRDGAGNFYYMSDSTRRFEEEMQQRVKERREKAYGVRRKIAMEAATSHGQ